MADQADNYWPEPTGPESDPGAGFPQPAEDLDALLDTVACDTFDEGRVHRMAQSVQLRIIAESLKVRDQAAANLLELLRQGEAINRPAPAPPLELFPSVGMSDEGRAGGGIDLRVPRSSRGLHPPLALEHSPLRRVRIWAGRHQFRAVAGVACLVMINACAIISLGVLARTGYQQAVVSQRGAAVEHLRGDQNFQFVDQVITQFCAPVPQTCMPPHPRLLDPKNQEVFQKALVCCQQFLDHHEANPAMRRETGRVQYWMGCILLLLGNQDEARIALVKALPPLQRLAMELPEQPTYQRMVGEIHLNLASLLAEEEATTREAEQAFDQALGNFTQLTQRYPAQLNYRFQLAQTHEQFGAFFGHAGRNREAKQEFDQTRRLLADLEQRGAGSSQSYQLGLAQSHLNLGSLQMAAGQYNQALKEFDKAGTILTKLPDAVASVPENRGQLAGQWNELSNRLLQKGRLADARHGYAQARDLWAGLRKAFPKDADYQSHLGFAFLQLALSVRSQGNLDESCRLFDAAVEHQRTALAMKPQCELYRQSLRDAYLALAATQLRRENYREAATAAVQLPRVNPSHWQEHFRTVSFLARCLILAEKDAHLQPTEKQELVASYGSQLQKHLHELTRQAPGNAAASNALAWFLATCPKPELRDPAQALALARKATRLEPRQGSYWNTLGVAYCRAKQWKQAIPALQHSIQLNGQGNCADWLFLAMAYWKLDREQEARRWYERALTWMDQHQSADEELLRFRDEATKLIGPDRALTHAAVVVGSED